MVVVYVMGLWVDVVFWVGFGLGFRFWVSGNVNAILFSCDAVMCVLVYG